MKARSSRLCAAAARSLNQIGKQVFGCNPNIQPTLTIRPGFPVRVIVTRDLVLAPYLALYKERAALRCKAS